MLVGVHELVRVVLLLLDEVTSFVDHRERCVYAWI